MYSKEFSVTINIVKEMYNELFTSLTSTGFELFENDNRFIIIFLTHTICS